MEIKPEDRLGDILIKRGQISSDQLDQTVQCQILFGGRLGINLLELGFITKEGLREVLEEKYETGSVRREDFQDISQDVASLVSAETAIKHKLIPLRRQGDTLEVAMLDPQRESSIQAITEVSSLKVEPKVALEIDIAWALEKYYGIKREARLINLDQWLSLQDEMRRQPEKKKKKAAPPPPEGIFPDPQDITAMEGIPQSLDEFWDRVGRTAYPDYHLPTVIKELQNAQTRDEIAKIVVEFASLIFERTMVFVVNQDMLMGLDARGSDIDQRTALALMLPLSRRSMFKTVLETGAYFLGPVPETSINNRFIAALGEQAPRSVLILPVFIAGKVAALLYGDMGHDQKITGKFSPLQQVTYVAGQAFERLIRNQKDKNLVPTGEHEGEKLT
ncbi:MAG: hypothetical protein R6V10_03635 [bacterium]